MCLIVFKDGKKAIFTKFQFEKMIQSNRDGLGVMFKHKNRIVVEKTIGDNDTKLKLWETIKNVDYYAMHSRLKTHGEIDEANCHPYEILNVDKGDKQDLYLMHNGVIHWAPEIDKKMSDTWNFIEGVLKPIAKANIELIWSNPNIQEMISKSITGSKLLLMRGDVDQHVLIFNEKAGDTITGCWLSNLHSTGDSYYNRYDRFSRNDTIIPPPPIKRVETINFTTKNGKVVKERGPQWWNGKEETKTTVAEKLTTALDKANWQEGYVEDQGYSFQRNDVAKEINPLDIANSGYTLFKIPKERENHLATILQALQGLSTDNMVIAMQEAPMEVASLILHFYEKNTMKIEDIISAVADDRKCRDMATLIRNLRNTKQAA